MCNKKAASKENEEYEYSNPHSNKKKGRNRVSKQLELSSGSQENSPIQEWKICNGRTNCGVINLKIIVTNLKIDFKSFLLA